MIRESGETWTNFWHRTTAGYAHMGDLWFAGLQAVAQKGWITPPVGPDPTLLWLGKFMMYDGEDMLAEV